ncbi:MAG TPA: hypothetical protein VJ183_01955 [Chloroflexia bacterium]|nr:hypothetical protein [Chloroflexia bacterium]
MGFLDRLFGRKDEEPQQPQQQRRRPLTTRPLGGEELTDEQAVERYRYMLRTAPPDAIEQAHAEAFARLTPEQRRAVLEELTKAAPEERATGDDPKSLARMATRAEMRQPGTLERTWSGVGGGGMGMGSLFAGSFLSSMAGMFVGSMMFNSFFGHDDYAQGYNEGYAAGDQADDAGNQDGGGDTGTDSGDYSDSGTASGDYAAGDYGGADYGGADYGGGDFGGDFGGGDFGGGDFGGGDF